VKNEDYTIYKNGTKTSRITLPISGAYPTYLNLKKQRFYCKACNGTFSASTSIVQKDCFISNHTKAKILIKATDAQYLTDIAKDCLVSTSTVQRVITTEAKNTINNTNTCLNTYHLMNLNIKRDKWHLNTWMQNLAIS